MLRSGWQRTITPTGSTPTGAPSSRSSRASTRICSSAGRDTGAPGKAMTARYVGNEPAIAALADLASHGPEERRWRRGRASSRFQCSGRDRCPAPRGPRVFRPPQRGRKRRKRLVAGPSALPGRPGQLPRDGAGSIDPRSRPPIRCRPPRGRSLPSATCAKPAARSCSTTASISPGTPRDKCIPTRPACLSGMQELLQSVLIGLDTQLIALQNPGK